MSPKRDLRFSKWLRAGMMGALALLAAPPAVRAQPAEERGKYLVEEIAKCGACHTPMVDGKLDATKHLKGAVLAFQPIGEVAGWHKTSPDLTPGSRLWQRWGEKGLTNFLVTGKGPSGNAADPPMPAYKMKQEDAEAVVQYLKSLK
jgi:mono/diheme cytochrome c family protein